MNNRMKKITSLFLSLLMIFSLCFGVTSNAASLNADSEYAETVEMNNDQLMEGYFNKGVKDLTRPVYRFSLFAVNRQVFPAGYEKEERVYNYLVPIIESIAAGERDNAEITIPVWVILGGEKGQTEYNKSDLGIKPDDDVFVPLKVDYSFIYNVLLRNAPYDLYWHDKTKGTSFGGGRCSQSIETVKYTENPTFNLIVATDYALNGAIKGTKVDTSKTKAVNTAVEEAARVVNTAKNKTDYEKLDYYREYICDAVKYNHDAISNNYDKNYMNPWQLIWVFDKDPSTDVVCEGYSKAFKHLCDNTRFDSNKIRCELAEGGMPNKVTDSLLSAAHMWNIVQMDDGKRYFADITSCDGDKPTRVYFLVGTEKDSNGFYKFKKDIHEGGYIYKYRNNYKYFDDFKEYYEKIGEPTFLNIANKDYSYEAPIKEYIVDFDLNGIGNGKPENQVVAEGGKIEKPEDPTDDDHIFEGWFTNKETTNKYDFNKGVKEDTTLYAKWKERIKHTINVIKGKVTGNTDKEDAKYGETVTITANAPEEGYEFDHWVIKAGDIQLADEESEVTTFKMPNGDVKVEATYKKKDVTPKEYKVTVTDGKANKKTYKAGETVSITANDKKDKEFVKWEVTDGKVTLKDAKNKKTTFKMPESNVTVKATYKDIKPAAKEYKVTVKATYKDEEKTVEPEKPLDPIEPVNPGSDLAGVVERILGGVANGLERIVKHTMSLLERIVNFIGNLFN